MIDYGALQAMPTFEIMKEVVKRNQEISNIRDIALAYAEIEMKLLRDEVDTMMSLVRARHPQ